MNLTPESFPMSASVRSSVLQRFTHPESLLRGAQLMDRRELDEYLGSYTDTALSPLDAVLRAADQTGDPALPPPAESALLAWVGESFELWEQDFPLDPAIATSMRQLKPLVARAVLDDSAFAIPGAHALHKLLDALHDAAIGWQADLGRSGEAVLKLLEESVSALQDRAPLGGPQQLALLIANATEASQRLHARGVRMAQRIADVERGRLRSAHARSTAIAAINQLLASAALPNACGSFLRGPWLESAQLVLLKFGANASEWGRMQEVMNRFAAALAPMPEEEGADAEASASAIRRSLERWLLSLQHQPDSAKRELGELEYLLLRALSGQSIQRAPQSPIPVTENTVGGPATVDLPAAIAEGQWVLLRDTREESLRMQVVLRQDEQQQLVLCRHSGQQPRNYSFGEFSQLLASGAVAALPSGATFSRALAHTAGVQPAAAAATRSPEPSPAPTPAQAAPVRREPPPAAPAGSSAPRDLPLPPLGTWLGFHDVDPPLLAKLAMHDAVRQLIIFVNRKGIELRRLEESRYIALVEDGQIDILEARSNFREEVERARRRLQQHGP
ncbi:DUF1631 family protein [Haliea sp. E17]|uniref:DUF1631 family protein n=1 Tax=Haliea sp. E17 TaxID=3401576 RepID=UPI003AAFABE2